VTELARTVRADRRLGGDSRFIVVLVRSTVIHDWKGLTR
jgi:hypothetical protein